MKTTLAALITGTALSWGALSATTAIAASGDQLDSTPTVGAALNADSLSTAVEIVPPATAVGTIYALHPDASPTIVRPSATIGQENSAAAAASANSGVYRVHTDGSTTSAASADWANAGRQNTADWCQRTTSACPTVPAALPPLHSTVPDAARIQAVVAEQSPQTLAAVDAYLNSH